jgi:GNAT superfamily N-acetyltransferase
MIVVTRMTETDIEGLMTDIYPVYFKESAYNGLTPDLEISRITGMSYLDKCSFIARDGDRIIAIAVADAGRTFYKEIEFDINMFYIHPDYRGRGVARLMRDTLKDEWERVGAKVIYSSCLSGVEGINEQLYLNLWSKVGFKKLGTVMIRI